MLRGFKREDVLIEIEHFENAFHIDALWCGAGIGRAICEIQGERDRLFVCDLETFDNVHFRRGFGYLPPRRVSFRRSGVGSKLLQSIIEEGKSLGVREIHGKISTVDDEPRPWLRGWYERKGFSILEPDLSDSIVPQAARIVMILD